MELTLRQYKHGSKDYKKAMLLRYCVLNLDDRITEESLAYAFGDHPEEADQFLLGAFCGEDLLATLNLEKQKGHLLLRQFAVHYKHQGKGIGTQLLKFAHAFAKEKGYHKIVLHARLHAIDFYKKAGYVPVEIHVYPEITLEEMYVVL